MTKDTVIKSTDVKKIPYFSFNKYAVLSIYIFQCLYFKKRGKQ